MTIRRHGDGGFRAEEVVVTVEAREAVVLFGSAAWWRDDDRRRLWMVRRWLTAHALAEAERRRGFQWVEDDAHVSGLRWRVLIGSLVSARISDVASSE
ncbi:hypothetical protein LR48_Vigan03g104800 [Vigna angularis]|uniref:Uncharacterized protein n=1 Tax=Phaseolus angularis TaxID=3914 RepID=A0A0L9U4G3_PHAAN|nr:hypothetical protein LR48_Vigan03g104800 [Vigna angularis]